VFKQQYGSDIPDFRHRSSANYYKNNPILYRQWMEFRVWTVNRFLFELINGSGGVREARPGIRIATWSLGIHAGPDSVEKLREYQGLDAAAMITAVRPDLHFIQTQWPDWMRIWLKADYCKHYAPFVTQIRERHPHIPLAIQADIGSIKNMRRSRKWLSDFAAAAVDHGYAAWTAYEYHLGKYMYDEAPRPLRAVRLSPERICVQFSKRVSVPPEAAFRVLVDGAVQEDLPVQSIEVDGSNVYLHCRHFPRQPFELSVSKVADTPELLLYPGSAANEVRQPCLIRVDA
jgi:hypothetical protein